MDRRNRYNQKEQITKTSRVCDQGQSVFKRDIMKLLGVLCDTFKKEDEETKEFAINKIVECVCYLPHKTSIYATILCLVARDYKELVEDIIKRIQEKFQAELNNGDRLVTRSTLSFLGELMNIGFIGGFQFLKIIYDLLNEAEQTLNESQDYYLYLVVNTLVVVLPTLQLTSKMECKNTLSTISDLMSKRDESYGILKQPFSDKILPTELQYLYDALTKEFQKEEMIVESIPKPYKEFKNDFKEKEQFKLDYKLYFNNKIRQKCVYQSPIMMSLFEDIIPSDVPNELEKYLIYQHVIDMATLFKQKKGMVISNLLNYDTNFNYNKILVEALFGEMLKLPVSSCRLIFYSSLFITLVKEDEQFNLKDTIQQAFNLMLLQLDNLDIECKERLLECLAHYISNIGYRFKWGFIEKELIDDSEQVQESKQMKTGLKKFITDLIYKITRLLYWEEVESLLPKAFHQFLTKDPVPELKFQSEDAINHGDYQIIQDQFSSKISDEEMQVFLQNEGNQIESSNDTLQEIFFQCVLDKSSKSLTHFETYFQRYYNTLKNLISKNNSQILLLNTVNDVWKDSEFHLHLHIDKLMSLKLVTFDIIIQWVFQILQKKDINVEIYWRLLFIIVEKVRARTSFIQQTYFKNKKSQINQEEEKEETVHLEKCYQIVQSEQKEMFLLIFKKISFILKDQEENEKEITTDKNDKNNSGLLARFKQFRKYKNSFTQFIPDIEGLFQEINNDKAVKIMNAMKALNFQE